MTETWPQCSFHCDGATTFGITAFSITILCIRTLSITIKTRHSSQWNSILFCRVSFMPSVIYTDCLLCWVSYFYCYVECHYASCHYAKCHNAECYGTLWHLKSIKFLKKFEETLSKQKNVKLQNVADIFHWLRSSVWCFFQGTFCIPFRSWNLC